MVENPFSGWFLFTTENVGEQLSNFGNGKPVPDTIWFGHFQGLEDECHYFFQAEIMRLKPKTWEISNKNLVYSGRRSS